MLLTHLAFWSLPDPRFARCVGGFGPTLDPSFGGFSYALVGQNSSPRDGGVFTVPLSPPIGPDAHPRSGSSYGADSILLDDPVDPFIA